jgi:molybdenum cofactor cytidylyltransferase
MTATAGLAAVILAAGASTRLGQPKALLNFRGQTLLLRTLRLAQVVASELVVVVGAEAGSIASAIGDEPCRVVCNHDWESGMASSLRVGLAALANPAGVLVMLIDQPLIEPGHLQQLQAVWTTCPELMVATGYTDGVGVPAIFPRSRLEALARGAGDSGARAMLRREASAVRQVECPEAALDIDTPADLERLRSLE